MEKFKPLEELNKGEMTFIPKEIPDRKTYQNFHQSFRRKAQRLGYKVSIQRTPHGVRPEGFYIWRKG